MTRARGRGLRRKQPASTTFDVVRLGASLKAARERRGVPLRTVAEHAGYSVTHISQIERGRTCPTIGALVRIAEALGHSPSFFLDGEARPEISAPGGATPRRFRARSKTTSLQISWLSSGIAGGKLVAGRVVVAPHESPEEMAVLRVRAMQLCHVLKGRLVMRAGQGQASIGPGDATMVQSGVDVYFHNPGPESAELVCLLVNERPGGTRASEFSLMDVADSPAPFRATRESET